MEGRYHEKKIGEECGVFEKWNARSLFSEIFRSLFFETSLQFISEEEKKKKKTSW
jgi:hypothetical protein